MSDNRIIMPGPNAPAPEDHYYKLPTGDRNEARFITMKKEVTLGRFFDDVFTKVLSFVPMWAGKGDIAGLMAAGSQVVWAFAAKANELAHERMDGIEDRIQRLEDRMTKLERAMADPPQR